MDRNIDTKHYITKVRLEKDKVPGFDRYPFDIPAVKGLDEIVIFVLRKIK